MNVDRYTKLVLTVIAVCLVWLSLGGPSLITPLAAQGPVGQRVLISGWVDETGVTRALPRPWAAKQNTGPWELPIWQSNNP